MGKGGSAPAPTPPGDTAAADFGAKTAQAGAAAQNWTPNLFSPGGSVQFDKGLLPNQQLGNGKEVPGGASINSVTTSFDPQFQSIFDTLTNKGQTLASNLPAGGFDPQIDTSNIIKAYNDQAQRSVQPVWDREDKAFWEQQRNLGRPDDSEAYRDARAPILESRNKFLEDTNDQAQLAAGNEQTRQYQLAAAQRAQPWQEFANLDNSVQGMLGFLQGTPTGPFIAQGGTDVAGITRAADQQKYNAWAGQQANANAGMGMGISAVSSILPFLFSDERVKEDIEQVGKTNDGQPIYRYHYKGEPKGAPMRMGLLAQNVEVEHPDAVAVDPASGFKMVDYEKATDAAVSKRRA